MVNLTVFTPTYNRKKLLFRCYKSLKTQTNKNFIWLIIDDGSSDHTKEEVDKWRLENSGFEIRYVFKENGGLHTAYNKAIELLDTELAVCIDSDDYMPDYAVDHIISFWKKYGSDQVAGIVGLDCDMDGNLIGDYLPDVHEINLIDILLKKYNYKSGDRKLVVRSDLYKSVAPMKTFPGEKNFNPNYMHMEISRKYNFLVLNERLCIVDYQPDGMSNNMIHQYYSSPRSFAELRKQHLSFKGISLRYKAKEYIHYISCCCLAKRWCGLENVNWALFILCCPFGFLLSLYIRYKNRSLRAG